MSWVEELPASPTGSEEMQAARYLSDDQIRRFRGAGGKELLERQKTKDRKGVARERFVSRQEETVRLCEDYAGGRVELPSDGDDPWKLLAGSQCRICSRRPLVAYCDKCSLELCGLCATRQGIAAFAWVCLDCECQSDDEDLDQTKLLIACQNDDVQKRTTVVAVPSPQAVSYLSGSIAQRSLGNRDWGAEVAWWAEVKRKDWALHDERPVMPSAALEEVKRTSRENAIETGDSARHGRASSSSCTVGPNKRMTKVKKEPAEEEEEFEEVMIEPLEDGSANAVVAPPVVSQNENTSGRLKRANRPSPTGFGRQEDMVKEAPAVRSEMAGTKLDNELAKRGLATGSLPSTGAAGTAKRVKLGSPRKGGNPGEKCYNSETTLPVSVKSDKRVTVKQEESPSGPAKEDDEQRKQQVDAEGLLRKYDKSTEEGKGDLRGAAKEAESLGEQRKGPVLPWSARKPSPLSGGNQGENLLKIAAHCFSPLVYEEAETATDDDNVFCQVAVERNLHSIPLSVSVLAEVSAVLKLGEFPQTVTHFDRVRQLHLLQGHSWGERLDAVFEEMKVWLEEPVRSPEMTVEVPPERWTAWHDKGCPGMIRETKQPEAGPELWGMGSAFLLTLEEMARPPIGSIIISPAKGQVKIRLPIWADPTLLVVEVKEPALVPANDRLLA